MFKWLYTLKKLTDCKDMDDAKEYIGKLFGSQPITGDTMVKMKMEMVKCIQHLKNLGTVSADFMVDDMIVCACFKKRGATHICTKDELPKGHEDCPTRVLK